MSKDQESDLNVLMGKKLRELRIASGFTSYENFAVEFDLARKYYWEVEKGKVRPSVSYIQKVLSFHNITLSEFFRSISP